MSARQAMHSKYIGDPAGNAVLFTASRSLYLTRRASKAARAKSLPIVVAGTATLKPFEFGEAVTGADPGVTAFDLLGSVDRVATTGFAAVQVQL